MQVWPPGSLDINPFDYFKCGVSRRGIVGAQDFISTMAIWYNGHDGLIGKD